MIAMSELYYLRSRVTRRDPAIYIVHAFTSVEEALREARRKMAGSDIAVWIVDDEGELVLPMDGLYTPLGQLHS